MGSLADVRYSRKLKAMTSGRTEPLPAAPSTAAAGTSAAPSAVESGLNEALKTLRKRKWIVIICVLLGFGYGWYKSATQVRLYTASGTIEIGSGSTAALRDQSASSNDQGRIATQVAILKSETVLLSVARDLDLPNNRDFMGARGPMPHLSLDDLRVRQAILSMLMGDVIVTPIPRTDLVRIACSTLNPKLSAEIVNKLVAEYIHRSFQSRYDATQRASDFLSEQLRDLKQQVQDSQARLIDLGKRLGNVGLDTSSNQITTRLQDLAHALGEAEVRRLQAQSRYNVLAHMDINAIDVSLGTDSGSSHLATLRAQLETAETQYAEQSANLGPRNPQIRSVQAQINELKRVIHVEESRLLTQAQQDLEAARINEETTRGALEGERANAFKLRDDMIDYSFRQRDYESERSLYDTLRQRLRSAAIEAGLESTEIDIVDVATPPVAPALQPRSTMLLVNTVVMLIIGLILAFVVDALDTAIQSVAELESITGLPSLALIPRTRRTSEVSGLTTAQRNLGVLASPKSQFSEAFRALRTSLLLSTPGAEPKVILLTSSTPSEGKTTIAVNLATVLAQRGVKVLLVDADLRRPAVHHRFGINGQVGLTSVLSGSVPLEQAVQPLHDVPGLDILVCGPVPPFPTEMLGSNAMHSLLEHARGLYTHIVLDSPPLLSVTDSVILSNEADAVVMIVRHGKSSKYAVRRGRELLTRAGSRIVGIVLNAVDTSSPEYYAYYGYYGYSGYSSANVDASGWGNTSQKSSTKKGERP